MIENEAAKGSDGEIIAKMNALVDTDMINALYHASSKGVKIKLIIRGICCLRPNIKGMSENIEVYSIIGKYLEHARILYFKHATPQLFISSADWMPRNLERRLELMTPIYDQSLQQKLHEILKLQLLDNTLSWKLENSGEYSKVKRDKTKPINNHALFEEYTNNLFKSSQNSSQKEKLAQKLFKES